VPGIDGLRGIAALSVVVLHTSSFGEPTRGWYALGWWSRNVLPHLAAGVPLFFVLSGFLLYRPYARAALDRQRRCR
jgi:peptidoglycan/LPS O-acetylase OafA/YrhL